MTGPKNGRYRILPAAYPVWYIGVDAGPEPVKPIIVHGRDNVVSPLAFVQRGRHLYHSFNFQSSFLYHGC